MSTSADTTAANPIAATEAAAPAAAAAPTAAATSASAPEAGTKGTAEPEASKTRLYVSNLPLDVKVSEIQELFSEFGTPKLRLSRNKLPWRKSKYVFAELASEDAAARALEQLNDKEYKGAKLQVQYARAGTAEDKEARAARQAKAKEARAKKAEAASATSAASGDSNGTDAGSEGAKPAAKPKRKAREELPLSDDTVFVAGLPLDASAEDVATLFASFDVKPTDVAVVSKAARNLRSQTQAPRRLAAKTIAFVKVGDKQTAAIEEVHDKPYKEGTLIVRRAKVPPPPRPEGAKEPRERRAPRAKANGTTGATPATTAEAPKAQEKDTGATPAVTAEASEPAPAEKTASVV